VNIKSDSTHVWTIDRPAVIESAPNESA